MNKTLERSNINAVVMIEVREKENSSSYPNIDSLENNVLKVSNTIKQYEIDLETAIWNDVEYEGANFIVLKDSKYPKCQFLIISNFEDRKVVFQYFAKEEFLK